MSGLRRRGHADEPGVGALGSLAQTGSACAMADDLGGPGLAREVDALHVDGGGGAGGGGGGHGVGDGLPQLAGVMGMTRSPEPG